MKKKGIKLKAKPLGRPSAEALSNQVSPGERNPIEGKFGQAKRAYGLDKVKAKLANTSESWIASIILVLNLVHLAEVALLWIKVLVFKIKIQFQGLMIQKNGVFNLKIR